MEPLSLLASLNKISLVAFLITLAFIAYQFYLFKKDVSAKKSKPNVPDFNENARTPANYTKVIVGDVETASFKKPNRLPLIIGIALMIVFGLIFFIGVINKNIPILSFNTQITPTPIINFVASKGIRIYNSNWTPLTDNQLATLSAGRTIYIGVETIGETDIDRARIRVNEKEWKTDNITLKLNDVKNVYYREYTIGTGTAALKIEAQLHSVADGWLGD